MKRRCDSEAKAGIKGFENNRSVSSCLLIGKKFFLSDVKIPGVAASVVVQK
jgi:hypothetical protein